MLLTFCNLYLIVKPFKDYVVFLYNMDNSQTQLASTHNLSAEEKLERYYNRFRKRQNNYYAKHFKINESDSEQVKAQKRQNRKDLYQRRKQAKQEKKNI